MSLDKVNEIDYIGIDNTTDDIILSIIDALDWVNEQQHLSLLQNKINSYLRFVESGEIYNSYPKVEGRLVEIKIYAKRNIPISGVNFLNKASEIVKQAGLKIQWKLME